jgi:putative tryptophan/tyrosine transport system substrate-binding protein
MRRRDFIKAIAGSAATWPLAARAQQGEPVRRIGVLMGCAESDSEAQANIAAFRGGLQKLGWMEGRNTRIDTRWATPDDADSMQRFAKELVALQPDLILTGPAVAQQPAKIPRVGILTPAATDATPLFQAFRKEIRTLGYVEGQTIVLDFRFARGNFDALPNLATELVRSGVDVIVTDSTSATVAAFGATHTIPIVMGTTSGDPGTLGLATSIARPGGNVTGMLQRATELSGKRLQLLKDAVPAIARVTVLFNPASAVGPPGRHLTEDAAKLLGVAITPLAVGTLDELRELEPAVLTGSDGLTVVNDGNFWNGRTKVVALALAARIPAIYPEREYADDGGLIAYGPNVPDHFRLAAGYVDRILRGAKAGDLPINQSTKIDFVVNLRTARALGIALSPDFISAAAEVIE